jgi:hypothetical protein
VSAEQRIGEITNYYGGLWVTTNDDKYYWGIENYNGKSWDRIPKSLYCALLDYEEARHIERQHNEAMLRLAKEAKEMATSQFFKQEDRIFDAQNEGKKTHRLLEIAVGLLSAQPAFANMHPEEVMAKIKEAK